MYEKFFRLHRSPFRMVPDQDCLHLTGQHADVISGAVFGIVERKGFVVLTGEAGLGKTTAIRAVMELLTESKAEISLISHPTLNAEDFLELALLNFGMPGVANSKAQRLKMLESFLTLADAEGKVCVLIIDEAHKLPPDALEEVRLLGNLQTDDHKLLQILLVGQNELNTRLNLPELWQLKQRISFRLNLERLNRDGVEEYIQFRWNRAGGAELPFDELALDAIAKWSSGIPRVINAICDNSLMLALSESVRTLHVEHIRVVCQDLHLATPAFQQRLEFSGEVELTAAKSAAARVEMPTLVRRAAVGGSNATPAPVVRESDAWSTGRPSLLQKWRGFLDTQKPKPSGGGSKDSGSLSLKKHL